MTDSAPLPLFPADAAKSRKQVFVAYSYRDYPKDDYRRVFKDLEEKYEVTFIFADEKITNMHIMKKIETFIRASDFSIFDISGWNPNMTLELGFAMAVTEQWYIALNPAKTEIKEVPSDLRGLDRIEYGSYTDLSSKLTVLMEQRYPKRKGSGIETFLSERRAQVRELLQKNPGLTITSMSQLLSLDVPVVQLVVKPMVGDELEPQGVKKSTKYYIKGTIPSGKPAQTSAG